MGVLTTKSSSETEKETFSPASSFIELVEYNAKEKTMDLTFRTGTKIRYIEVYASTFQSFKQSPTHSAYYARAIKGNLQATKIIDSSIGTQKSSPLKKIQRKEPLDEGLRQQQSRDERIAGTVERAFNIAAIAA